MSTQLRVVRLGEVSALRSQAVYHAVAETAREGDAPTLLVLSPSEPYVCVGWHQDVEVEVDLEACREAGYPVYRRQVGGGAVFLDGGQVFFQLVYPPGTVSGRLDALYRPVLEAAAAVYQGYGVDASFRPVNDLIAGQRKVCGAGAARIGDAQVVVGNVIRSFDHEAMASVLRVPDEKFRDKLVSTMRAYVSSLEGETGTKPPRDEVETAIAEVFPRELGMEAVDGKLTERELAAVGTWEERIRSQEWTFQGGFSSEHRRVRIATGVDVAEARHKARGGLLRTVLVIEQGRIGSAALSGDFFLTPGDALTRLEEALKGSELDEDTLGKAVDRWLEQGVELPGVTRDDVVTLVMQAAEGGGPD